MTFDCLNYTNLHFSSHQARELLQLVAALRNILGVTYGAQTLNW